MSNKARFRFSAQFDAAEVQDRRELASAVKSGTKLPRNAPRIDRIRWVVEHHEAIRTEGVYLDATTAHMLLKVHDALNETNRAKFVSMKLRRMVDIGWKLCK